MRQKPSVLLKSSEAPNALCSVEYCDCLFQARKTKPYLMNESVDIPGGNFVCHQEQREAIDRGK